MASKGDGGYVKIMRRLLDDTGLEWREAMLFVTLILLAAWRDTRARYRGREIQLGRGQLVVSVRDLAERTGMSKSAVSRDLQKFEALGMIMRSAGQPWDSKRDSRGTVSGTVGTTITICKYSEYQDSPDADGTPSGLASGQSKNFRGTQNNKEKKGKKINTPPICPPQAAPDEWLDWAINEKRWTRNQAKAEASRFLDYSHANGKSYKDWFAAWRNWCRSPFQKTVAPAQAPLTL